MLLGILLVAIERAVSIIIAHQSQTRGQEYVMEIDAINALHSRDPPIYRVKLPTIPEPAIPDSDELVNSNPDHDKHP